ncbi:hypothetical protein BFS16_12050 [Hoylesella timonensis]|uniref:Uncharacterized protein n=1 Tax=Hoylesella timonensis TaxID=386414 RepID=A0A2K0XBZ1_9BACT|nr:hypothetical protein [Hoylesella timonensis]PNP92060.1 hypothetical protein BFS16_12050 [Hoylesella timonensis]
MDREDLESRVLELIDYTSATMKLKVKKVLDSGAIDIDSADDNYVLPKIILRALLKDAEFSVGSPIGEERMIKKEVDNIYALI